MDKCDVCGTQANIAGVAGSSLGPISITYCNTCLTEHREPEFLFEFTYEEIGTDVAPFVKTLSTYVDGRQLSWDEWVSNKTGE